jgi:hypothetical protein
MLIANRPLASPALLIVMVSMAVNEVSRWLVCAARLIAWRGLADGGAVPQPAIVMAPITAAPTFPTMMRRGVLRPAPRLFPNTRGVVLMLEL